MVVGHDDCRVIEPLPQQRDNVGLGAEQDVSPNLIDDAGDPLIVSRFPGAVLHRVVPPVLRHASMLAPVVPSAKALAGSDGARRHAAVPSATNLDLTP